MVLCCTDELKLFSHQAVPNHLKNSICVSTVQRRIFRSDAYVTIGFFDCPAQGTRYYDSLRSRRKNNNTQSREAGSLGIFIYLVLKSTVS